MTEGETRKVGGEDSRETRLEVGGGRVAKKGSALVAAVVGVEGMLLWAVKHMSA